MDLKTGIFTYLTANPSVINNAPIYPLNAPNDSGMPYLTYSIRNRQGILTQAGATGASNADVEFTIYSQDTVVSTQISAAMISTLDGFGGKMGTVVCPSVELKGDLETDEKPQDASDNWIYHSTITFHFHCFREQ